MSQQANSYKLLVALYRHVLRRVAEDRAAFPRRTRVAAGQAVAPVRVRLGVGKGEAGPIVLSPARVLRLTRLLYRSLRPRLTRAKRRVRVLWTLLVRPAAGAGGGAHSSPLVLRVMVEPLQARVLWSVTPTTGDLAVNLTAVNNQISPDVAIAADGSFVAVWESDGGWDGDKRGIFARRFAADGTPLTGEFVVNATTAGEQTDPAVAADNAGNFVVTWVSDHTPKRGIFARQFAADGTPTAGEVLVNSHTTADQANPAVAMNGAGEFVIAWEGAGTDDGDGVFAQRFGVGGGAAGANLRVNAVTGSKQYNAAVAVAADGSFVVTHTDDSGGRYIAAQRFDNGGAGQGQFAVDLGGTTSGNSQDTSAVAAADDNSFVVAWAGSGASSRVAVRRFAADGTPAGSAFRADPAALKEQVLPRVAVGGAGNFLVAWQDNAIDGDAKGIGAAAFNADGTRNGGVFQAAVATRHDQKVPAVALDDANRAVLVWGGERAGDSEGITARRFDLGAVLTPNQPPVNVVPGPQAGTEDVPIVFSAAGGNAIAVADPDAGGSFLQVTLSASAGTLTLAATVGLTFGAGTGASDATMTFAGSASAINAALDGLTYAPPANASGTYSITIVTDDQGNTGTGGAGVDTDAVAVTIAAANDAPVNTVPAGQSTAEDTGIVFSAGNGNAISVADVDAGTVRMTLSATAGGLTLASLSGLTFTAGDGTADGTMTFAGTVAAVNTALNGLTYSPAADFSGVATLTITTDDQGNTGTGGPLADTDTVAVTVTAVNDAPVNQLPPGQSVNGGSLLFSSSVGSGISISDVDAGGAAVQVALSASAGTLSLSSTAGLTFTSGDGSNDAVMTFRGTTLAINAALEGMSYQPPFLFIGTATISVATDDLGNAGAGGAMADTDVLSVNATYPNTAPVNTVPGPQTVSEDGNLVLSSAAGNAISVADSTAGGGAVKLTLAATNGTLSLAGTAGLTFLTGDGSSDASMSFTGTLAAVNNALNGLVYRPAADYFGPATISVSTDDQGNSGTGGARTDTDSVAVTVSPLPDPPAVTATPATLRYTENDPATPVDPGIVVSEPDGVLAGAMVAITQHFKPGQDVLSFPGTANITGAWNATTGTLTLTGTDAAAAYQAALRSVHYTNSRESPAAALRQVTFTVTDGGTTAVATRYLDVTPVNDTPTLAHPLADQAATEDVAFTYQVPADAFDDVDDDALTYAASRADGSALPGWLSFDPAARTFAGTPQNGDDETVSVRVSGIL